MVTRKKFESIEELQAIQFIASKYIENVELQSEEGAIIIDAKSFIGLYTLDFKKPILVVSESEALHGEIEKIGQNV